MYMCVYISLSLYIYIYKKQKSLEVLDGLDPDPEAQEMILEQFVAEAQKQHKRYRNNKQLYVCVNNT